MRQTPNPDHPWYGEKKLLGEHLQLIRSFITLIQKSPSVDIVCHFRHITLTILSLCQLRSNIYIYIYVIICVRINPGESHVLYRRYGDCGQGTHISHSNTDGFLVLALSRNCRCRWTSVFSQLQEDPDRSTPYIGDDHPTRKIGNPYNRCFLTLTESGWWVHPLTQGTKGSLDPSTYVSIYLREPTRAIPNHWKNTKWSFSPWHYSEVQGLVWLWGLWPYPWRFAVLCPPNLPWCSQLFVYPTFPRSAPNNWMTTLEFNMKPGDFQP